MHVAVILLLITLFACQMRDSNDSSDSTSHTPSDTAPSSAGDTGSPSEADRVADVPSGSEATRASAGAKPPARRNTAAEASNSPSDTRPSAVTPPDTTAKVETLIPARPRMPQVRHKPGTYKGFPLPESRPNYPPLEPPLPDSATKGDSTKKPPSR